MKISRQAHNTLVEGVEELVFEICSQELVSGECLYTVLEALAQAKLAEFQGELAAS